jgi:hypothetical protein
VFKRAWTSLTALCRWDAKEAIELFIHIKKHNKIKGLAD